MATVCHLQPHAPASQLKVVNNLVVERYPSPLADLRTESPSLSGPVVYGLVDRTILDPFIAPATGDDDPGYRTWLGEIAQGPHEIAIDFLRRINTAIHSGFSYAARYEAGTQDPGETVALNAGTCRDFAWLMVESARRFGFAARFATGYLYAPGAVVRGAGATHAWCEIFLPRMGWMEFDPTNALVESSSLIRVATARTWQECDPMNGAVFGDAACELKVAVDVDLIGDAMG